MFILKVFTTKSSVIIIGVSWLCAFAWAIPIVFPAGQILILNDEGYAVFWDLSELFAKFEIGFSFGVISLILISYVCVFSVVKKKRTAMKAQKHSSKQSTDEIKILIQSFIIFLGMTMVLLSSYSYYLFVMFWDETTAEMINSSLNSTCVVLFYSCNPILYLIFSSNIRQLVFFCKKPSFSKSYLQKLTQSSTSVVKFTG